MTLSDQRVTEDHVRKLYSIFTDDYFLTVFADFHPQYDSDNDLSAESFWSVIVQFKHKTRGDIHNFMIVNVRDNRQLKRYKTFGSLERFYRTNDCKIVFREYSLDEEYL